jgi:hypothetical protein
MVRISSKKINISIIMAILVLCGLLLGNTIYVKAYDNVELILSESGAASPPIFSGGSPPIAPGSHISQKFSIKNSTNKSYNIVGFKFTNFKLVYNGSDEIEDTSLINHFTDNIKITLETDGSIFNTNIFNGTMSELLKNNGISIDKNIISISKGGSKKFLINVYMNELADNSLQGLQANFGTNFNAVSDDGSSANTGGGGAGSGGNTGPGGTNITPTTGGPMAGDTNQPTTQPQGGEQGTGSTNIPVSTTNSTDNTKQGGVNLPSSLTKTGSFIDTETLLTIGILATCSGLILILKKNKK